jgi:hypothetical protein
LASSRRSEMDEPPKAEGGLRTRMHKETDALIVMDPLHYR